MSNISAFDATPTKVPTVSNKSTNRKAKRAINISVDKILLKSNFIKIGAILEGFPIIAFGSSETPQIIDTAVVANIPNKIAPGTFFTINKIVNKMPKIVINEVALVIVPKSRGIPFPCLTSPA